MYKLVNGLLPDVMNELYTTNDQIHNHFTRQCNFFHINKGHSNFYAKKEALEIYVRESGTPYRKKCMVMCQ